MLCSQWPHLMLQPDQKRAVIVRQLDVVLSRTPWRRKSLRVVDLAS